MTFALDLQDNFEKFILIFLNQT